MKRLLTLAFTVLLWCAPAPAAVSFVQEVCNNAATSSVSTLSCTVPAAGVGAGHLLVIISGSGPGTTPTSATDTAGDTLTISSGDPRNNNGFGTNGYTSTFQGISTSGLSSGNTISVGFSSSSYETRSMLVIELAGNATSSYTDGFSAGMMASYPQTSPGNSGNITTTNADDGLVGACNWKSSSGTATPTSGFTFTGTYVHGSNHTLYMEYRIVSSTGSYASTPSFSSNQYWTCYVFGFKAGAGGGGGGAPPTLSMMGVGD
jgi:hypothetical protein